MGIFSRFRDIVSSNLNAILDKAEDPEKMIRLMIQEMEDTLIEVKSECAAVIADQKKQQRLLADVQASLADWERKARLAVQKGRDDLARAALEEKNRYAKRVETVQRELESSKATVAQYHEDLAQLEEKLADAREKQRTLIQRHAAAVKHHDTQSKIRKVDTSEAFVKFEAYENNIERLEAEAGLVDSLRPRRDGNSLKDQFDNLEHAEEVEKELEKLKNEMGSEA